MTGERPPVRRLRRDSLGPGVDHAVADLGILSSFGLVRGIGHGQGMTWMGSG